MSLTKSLCIAVFISIFTFLSFTMEREEQENLVDLVVQGKLDDAKSLISMWVAQPTGFTHEQTQNLQLALRAARDKRYNDFATYVAQILGMIPQEQSANYLATMIKTGSTDTMYQVLKSWLVIIFKGKALSELQKRQLRRAFMTALDEKEWAIAQYILQHFPVNFVLSSEKEEKEKITAFLRAGRFELARTVLDVWLSAKTLSDYKVEEFEEILQEAKNMLRTALQKFEKLVNKAAKLTGEDADQQRILIYNQQVVVTAYREIIFLILERLKTRITNITRALPQIKRSGVGLTQKQLVQLRAGFLTAHAMVRVIKAIITADTNQHARQLYQQALGSYNAFINNLVTLLAPELTQGELLDLIKSGNEKAAQQLLVTWKMIGKELSSDEIKQLQRAYITALGTGNIELIKLLLENFSEYIITPEVLPYLESIFKQEELKQKDALALFYSLKEFFSVQNFRDVFLMAIDRDFLRLAFLIASEGMSRFESPFIDLLINYLIDAIKRGNVKRVENMLHIFTELETTISADRLNEALKAAPARARQRLEQAVTSFLDPSRYAPFITVPSLVSLPELSQPLLGLIATALVTYLRSHIKNPPKSQYH